MAYVRSQLIAQKKCYFFICHDPSVLSYLMSVCVVCIFPHVCTRMCGGLQLSLGVFLDPSLPNLSKQGFSTEPTARHKASLARQLAQEVSCLCLLGAEIKGICHSTQLLFKGKDVESRARVQGGKQLPHMGAGN